ncbi:electron transport complex subunit RsxC [Magnetospira sp. QH-2]|uniref:electron transport complex subunit RsxC n=1 Tax=Magnetospira sp. (strain QH-2) TaxID=1288970 RepID=UPI0003E80D9D|nr:electron transport complex subunit RsxC [Magnetospira sp. QH-2]CCQ72922.1 Electron transport complex protein rnfC, 4Fe-4S ferredoxin-type protein [Magnetospira sp. QH-2]
MKLFSIRGGVNPEGRKSMSSEKPIRDLPLPDLLQVPLQQHVGTPAAPLVEAGDLVLKGQLLAAGDGVVSAAVHAPTSGEIVGIGMFPAPHPSGLPVHTVTLKPDGKDQWGDLPAPMADPFACTPEEIAERVAQSGIVGLGGGVFPSAIKLNLREQYDPHTLVLNGAECEPYLTCDDRLMREYAAEVIDGARIMAHALGAKSILIGIETNKPAALAAMRVAATPFSEIRVAGLPVRYPMGSEKHLVQALTGVETPSGQLTAVVGYVVHNSATAFAVSEAVRHGRPLINRIVTVSGGAIQAPANLRVPLGVSVNHILKDCGGLKDKPEQLLSGGPMMGQPLTSLDVPAVKGMNAILALTRKEARQKTTMPCIRCGDCVDICPCGLVPLDLAAEIKRDDIPAALRHGLAECMSCGSCSYVCPSHIPLVQYFNHAKGKAKVLATEEKRIEGSKDLAARRNARLERELAAKKAKMAARKAEAAKKAEAARKAKEAEETANPTSPAGEPVAVETAAP